MSLPGDWGRDLSLEPLDDREDTRRTHLGEAAPIRTLEGAARSVERFSAACQALVAAAFTVAIVTPLREWRILGWIRRSGLRFRGLAKGQGS
ncbi:MAG TPA: hypothetical protein VMG10_32660 [Gemmataceae bacterium]|nr:hypothetical protein [Gemmataceae bacterium]